MEFATVNSAAEVTEFNNQRIAHGCSLLWINFLQLSPNQFTYRAIDGASFPVPYSDIPWGPAQPDASGAEECIALTSDGTYHDYPCSGHSGCYVCTEDPVRAPTAAPTVSPTTAPTAAPTATPTVSPTTAPTAAPTATPTFTPASDFLIHSISDVTAESTSGTTLELHVSYNASNRDHDTIVLSPNCIDPFTGTAATAFTVTTTPDMSLGNGYIAYNNTIEVDISKINGTEYWQDLSPSGGNGGIFNLCLESAIFFELNGQDEKMNFANTNVTLTIEMNADFEVTAIDAERKGAIEEEIAVDYSDYVEAYQCLKTSPDTPLAAPLLPTYEQGDVLTVCIRGTTDSTVDVSDIKMLQVSQAGGTSSPFTYVNDGVPVDTEVVEVTCGQGTTDVCVADILLLGRFFSVENPGDLTVSGEVVFLASDSRRLEAAPLKVQQSLPVDATRRAEEEGKFAVTVALDGAGAGSSFSASFTPAGMLASLLVGTMVAIL